MGRKKFNERRLGKVCNNREGSYKIQKMAENNFKDHVSMSYKK